MLAKIVEYCDRLHDVLNGLLAKGRDARRDHSQAGAKISAQGVVELPDAVALGMHDVPPKLSIESPSARQAAGESNGASS